MDLASESGYPKNDGPCMSIMIIIVDFAHLKSSTIRATTSSDPSI